MIVTAHEFYYSASCDGCGNEITISYQDIRACFSGKVPDGKAMEGSLLCICELATTETSLSSVVPLKH